MTTPKKAGSLIIGRPVVPNSDNDFYDYKILFLSRNHFLTFANSMAFPGGKIEDDDLKYLRNSGVRKLGVDLLDTESVMNNLFKVSALRETYEETGLFFTQNTVNEDSKLKSLLQTHHKAGTHPDFYTLADTVDIAYGKEVMEFMRMITPVTYKHRYDAQFFICWADPLRSLNIPLGLKNCKDINNLQDLHINLKESSKYEWLNPKKALVGHFSKEFELAPPQILMLNIMLSFKKFEDIYKFLVQTRKKAYEQQPKIVDRINPLTFPLLPTFTRTNEEFFRFRGLRTMSLFVMDHSFSVEKELQNEENAKFREELKKNYDRIQPYCRQEDVCRFYWPSRDPNKIGFLVEVSVGLSTPLEGLRSMTDMQALNNMGSL